MERITVPPPPVELQMPFKTQYSLEAQMAVDDLMPLYRKLLEHYHVVSVQAKQGLNDRDPAEAEKIRAGFEQQATLIKQEIIDFIHDIELKMKEFDMQSL